MTALTGRRRARIAAVLTGTTLAGAAAAIVAGAASAHPPLPAEPGGPTIVCTIQAPPDMPLPPGPVRIEQIEPLPTEPGPHVRIERAEPLPPGVALPDCPDIGPHGIISVRPAEPGGPQVTIERGRPGESGVGYVQPAQPARIAPTGSSGS
ncbi:hypothetical protein [Nocardia sp. NBC_01009]|uniref:hypothetical protein n=1 Tax=Nocardia sp. NBC_01009 TaxID=2975996 RepID=UPI00386C815A|nr:hypothetical protein OHA42_13410 [Nocardia sp. NBC_01009]